MIPWLFCSGAEPLQIAEAVGKVIEDVFVGRYLHDGRSPVSLGLQQLNHLPAVQVAIVHRGMWTAVAGLLEVDYLDHIHGQRLQFRQRVAAGKAPQLIGGVGAEAQKGPFAFR